MVEPASPHLPRRIGIVGAGQLARMMGEAAAPLGLTTVVLAAGADDPAVATCDEAVVGGATDQAALDALAARVNVITFDHEQVDLDQIADLERRGVVVRPGSAALLFAVDKARQREAFSAAGLPVPRFVVTRSSRDAAVTNLLANLDRPPVVKAARGGYDGRGVLFPTDRDQALTMIDDLAATGEVVVEESLELTSEVAQLLVRGVDGHTVTYPLVTTVQRDGMCVEVHFPADVTSDLATEAAEIGQRVARLIGAVGVVAVELFVTPGGLVVNEIALRPHNSGHWTIEGAATSQFANHLRAVAGLPLGDVTARAPAAVMVNLVGADQPGSPERADEVVGAHVHAYGKAWRPGRKLGHVTAVGDDPRSVHVTAWSSALAYGTRAREV